MTWSGPPSTSAPTTPTAAKRAALIDEVRQEHGRAQARLAGVAFYEERIARLEQAGNGESRPGTNGSGAS